MPTDSESNLTISTINALHEAYLAARGLTLAFALAAGIRSASSEEIASRLGLDKVPSGGLLIPYTGADGVPYYYRARLDSVELP